MKLRFKDKINYILLYGVVYPLSLVPLRVLYLFADVTAWLARCVVHYRRGTVRRNIEEAFPDRDTKELRRIEKGFYHWLADYGVETLKLLTMSERTIRRRLVVENPEPVSRALEQGRNVTLFLGHYCNWEWVSSLPVHFPKDAVCAQVYHPLHNKAMDRLFIRIRTHFHANNEPMKEIMRFLIDCKRSGRPSVTGFIADQRPGWEAHLFVDFLNHDTAVFTGPERISKFLDSEVYYCHLSRPKRGRYVLKFVPITDTPKKEPYFSITRRYFEMLQDNIDEAPQYYLWSHKRWKYTREQYYERWGDHKDEMLAHL